MSNVYAIIDKTSDEVLNVIECEDSDIQGFVTDSQYAVSANRTDAENYPIIGGLYKKDSNKFVFKIDQCGTKPWPSWVLDDRNLWRAPVPYPTDGGFYGWDEQNQKWFRWP